MLFIELAKVLLFIHSIRRVALGGYGIPAIPTHPSFPTLAPLFLPLHALLFPFSPHLFSSSYSLLLSSASTDADARNGRRGCSYRPTRMLVSIDADARIDRRGCSYRPTRMTFVDVSQCQTFTFVLSNLYFRAAKPLLSQCQTVTFVLPNHCFCGSRPPFLHFTRSFSFHIFLCFSRSVVLSCCVHPLVAALKTVSLAYNNIMCASTMWCFNCKQLLKRT